MGLSSRGFLLLRGVALLLAAAGCSGASPHSLRYFYTGLSEPGQGLPQFITVGYVDDQPFVKYESHARKMLPQAPWMEKVVEYEAGYWERQSQILQGTESAFRVNLGILRERFKQQNSTGLHTLQLMYGCEVGLDGQLRGGHYQFAYDGEDFLAFDRETVSWVAAVPQAEISKQELDRRQDISQGRKDYLEGTCVEWLRRYLGYGKEALLRTEAPMMRVSHKKGYNGQETLLCQLYGFYPKDIEVTWMKDGEDRKLETLTGGVVPNSDGTYHTWISIEVVPKERDRYWCRVGHDSLPEPLNLAWEKLASNWGRIVSIVGRVLLAVAVLVVSILVGVFALRRKRKEKSYEAASRDPTPLAASPKSPPGSIRQDNKLTAERPTWRVACKKGYDGRETLFCYLDGFYPKEIEVSWVKDGEDRKPHTWTGDVVPNSDGTYNTCLSIDVDPKEKDHYWCHVEHDSLPEPLVLAWEEPGKREEKGCEAASTSKLGLILGSVGGVLLPVAILGVVFVFRRKKMKSYEAASNAAAGVLLTPVMSVETGSLRAPNAAAGVLLTPVMAVATRSLRARIKALV